MTACHTTHTHTPSRPRTRLEVRSYVFVCTTPTVHAHAHAHAHTHTRAHMRIHTPTRINTQSGSAILGLEARPLAKLQSASTALRSQSGALSARDRIPTDIARDLTVAHLEVGVCVSALRTHTRMYTHSHRVTTKRRAHKQSVSNCPRLCVIYS